MFHQCLCWGDGWLCFYWVRGCWLFWVPPDISLYAPSSVRISTIPAFGTIMETVTQREVMISAQAVKTRHFCPFSVISSHSIVLVYVRSLFCHCVFWGFFLSSCWKEWKCSWLPFWKTRCIRTSIPYTWRLLRRLAGWVLTPSPGSETSVSAKPPSSSSSLLHLYCIEICIRIKQIKKCLCVHSRTSAFAQAGYE